MTETSRYLTASSSLGIILMLLVSPVILVGADKSANAQSQIQDNSIQAYKMPRNWKKYFEDKYKQLDMITSTVQETPQGPNGHLSLSGKFNVLVEAASGDREDYARAIAQAFLRNEKEVLGIRDLSELREYAIKTDQGYGGEHTDIYYSRYIGELPVNGSRVHITIGPDLIIWHVSASLVPSPAELYEAAAKKLITEEEAIHIVEQDMKAMAVDPKKKIISETSIFATAKPPYIFWVVSTGKGALGWNYTLDAITGDRIGKKKQIWIH